MKLVPIYKVLVDQLPEIFPNEDIALKAIEEGMVKVGIDSLKSNLNPREWNLLTGQRYLISVAKNSKKSSYTEYEIRLR